MTFQESLTIGKQGEEAVHNWLTSKGYSVIPLSELPLCNGFGPRCVTAAGRVILPDLLIKGPRRGPRAVDVKVKRRFTFHRNSNCWQTGISLSPYNDYQRFQEEWQIDVDLLLLHPDNTPHKQDLIFGRPYVEPPETGLYWQSLNHLKCVESHRSERWDHGMVYWPITEFKLIASLDELEPFFEKAELVGEPNVPLPCAEWEADNWPDGEAA